MQLMFFTVFYSPRLFLLFAVVLTALLHVPGHLWKKAMAFGKGHVPGLAYGPGIDAPLKLYELPCGKH